MLNLYRYLFYSEKILLPNRMREIVSEMPKHCIFPALTRKPHQGYSRKLPNLTTTIVLRGYIHPRPLTQPPTSPKCRS